MDCGFKHPAEKLLLDRKNSFAKSPRKMKKKFVPEKFFQKCSSGHIACSSDNRPETLAPEPEKNISQCPKMIKNSFQKTLLIKMLLSRRRMQFRQHCRSSCARREQNFCSCINSHMKLFHFLYRKLILSESVPLDTKKINFRQRCQKLSWVSNTFC